jgi:serine protease Do
VTGKPIGTAVTLSYYRDGKPRSLKVTLGEFPAEGDSVAEAESQSEPIGVHLQDVTPDIGRFLQLPDGTRGAIIAEVVPGSRAARAGLKAEDVIVEVDRKPVESAADAASALQKNASAAHILRVRRGGSTRFVTVPGR